MPALAARAADGDAPTRRRFDDDRADRWFAVAAAFAVLPVVVAAIAALVGEWTAVGDNGYFLLRSRDVFSEHAPLLGTWTSSSLVLGFDVNNPGPLYFYLLSVPSTLWGSAGLVVAVAAMGVASVLGIGFALRRAGGPVVATLGLVAVTGLVWSVGRPLLVDPWQPHSLLLPFLVFLVLAWLVGAGDAWMLPVAVFVASVLVQMHLSYVYVVPAVGLAAVAGLVLVSVRRRRRMPDAPPVWSDTPARAGATAVVVGLVCWVPPLIEQFARPGRGNLSRLLDAVREGAPTMGAEVGITRTAQVLALWPSWLRPSFEEQRVLDVAPSFEPSLVALLAAAAVLVGAGVWAWRRRARTGLAGILVAAVAATAAVYTTIGIIESDLGFVAHHVRYLWPLAVFAQLAVAVVVVRSLGSTGCQRVAVVAAALVVVLSLATLPDVERASGPNTDIDARPVVQSMNSQLGELEGRGTILVDFSSIRPFHEPFSAPLLAELGRRGIDFVVDDDGEIRQLGQGRAFEGDAQARLYLRWGPAALPDEPDAQRIAFASALDDDEIARWAVAREELVAALDAGAATLTSAGRAAADRGELGLAIDGDGMLDVAGGVFLAERQELRDALERGWVRVEGVSPSTIEDWVTLHPHLAARTVTVWLSESLEPPGSA